MFCGFYSHGRARCGRFEPRIRSENHGSYFHDISSVFSQRMRQKITCTQSGEISIKRRTSDLGIVRTCDRTVRIYFLDRKIPFAVDINMSSFYATTGCSL